MASIPSNGYAEVMSGTNNYSGSNSFDGSCPRTAIPPVIGDDLCNKTYVDAGGGGLIGTLTDKGSLITGDGTQAVIFDQNPYQTALTTTTVYDWNSLAIGQSRQFTTTVPTLIPLGAGITITYSGTDSIKGNITAVAGSTFTITITALASAGYVATGVYTSNPPAGVLAGSVAPPSFNFTTNPAVSTPNPPIIPANTMITDGISFIHTHLTPTNFTVNLISNPAGTTLGSSTPTPASAFPAPNNFQFVNGAFVSTPTLFIIQIANLTQSVNFQFPIGGGFVPPDYCGQLNGYSLAYSTGSIVIDDDIALIADATSVTGLAWGVVNTASIGAVTSVSGGVNIVMSGTIPAPVVNLRNPLTAELNMGSQSLRDSANAVGTSGQVLSCGTGGQTLWAAGGGGGNPTITDTNTNATFFPTFVAGAGTQPLLADISTGAISLNPSNGNLNVVDTLKLTQSELAIGKGAGTITQAANAIAVGLNAGNNNQAGNCVAIGGGAGALNQQLSAVAVGAGAGNTTQGQFTVAIGVSAGSNTQETSAVAIGNQAGFTTQRGAAVAIGVSAGTTNQGISAVAVGNSAGATNQGASAVSVGNGAGTITQSGSATAVGSNAGQNQQGGSAVAIGANAGITTQGQFAVSVGASAGATIQGVRAVAIGVNAGNANQGARSVGIGEGAGQTSQNANSVAIGNLAGQNTQGANAVAIGLNAGVTTQGVSSVAIGSGAGITNQGASATAVGAGAGATNQSANSTAIGIGAGQSSQGVGSVAIGSIAGGTSQGSQATAVGQEAGNGNQGLQATAVGFRSGQISQGVNSVAIGNTAGQTTQGASSVAIGSGAGLTSQGTESVAIGFRAGEVQGAESIAIGKLAGFNQGAICVAIGDNAGSNGQGTRSISIGQFAGQFAQQSDAIAIGDFAGTAVQSSGAIAIGKDAGRGVVGFPTTNKQGVNAVAIGTSAGQNTQGAGAVSIGLNAGQGTTSGQGVNSIAIGNNAGVASQTAGSICLNATGVALNPNQAGLFIDPIRNLSTISTFNLQYNPTTEEVVSFINEYDRIMEDFTMYDTTTNFFGNNLSFAESGSGITSYNTGVYHAGIVAGARGRKGILQLNSGGAAGSSTQLLTDLMFSFANITKVTFGFIPHSNENLATVPVAAGNITQQLGISDVTSPTGVQTSDTIIWRMTSSNAGIPAWTFVINNVVQYTLTITPTNMTAKWCRVEIDLTYGGGATSTVSSTWYNLTDGTQETTPTFTITAGTGFPSSLTTINTCGIVMGCFTNNATNKFMGVDYVEVQQDLYPVGSGNTDTTGR